MEREHFSESRARRVAQTAPRNDRRKKAGRRPRRILGLWARLALLVLFIGVLGLAMFGLVTKAIRPYREAQTQRGQMKITQQQIDALDQQNGDLRRRIAYVNTDEGKMNEARKMGYVKPGEIPIVVEGAAPAPSTPAFLPPTVSPPKKRPRSHRFGAH